jgi:hypothetical protein
VGNSDEAIHPAGRQPLASARCIIAVNVKTFAAEDTKDHDGVLHALACNESYDLMLKRLL